MIESRSDERDLKLAPKYWYHSVTLVLSWRYRDRECTVVTGNGWCKMASRVYPAPRGDDDETFTGGPIAALVIAVPVSLILWGIVFLVLFNLVR
jgi:hypothetical protein